MTTPPAPPGSKERPSRYLDLFAVAEFRLIAAGSALQLSASMVLSLTLSVVVYEQTGSPLLAAVAVVSGYLPHVVGATLFLAIADRARPRRALVGFELLRAALAVTLAFGHLPVWMMFVLVMSVGSLAPVNTAVRSALVSDVLTGDAYVLGRSVLNMLASSAQIVGAAIGSLLLATIGATGSFATVAVTSLVGAAAFRYGLAERPARGRQGQSAVRQTWRVNRYLLHDAPTRGLLLAQWLPMVLVAGAEGLFIPYAAGWNAPSAGGVLFGAAAAGMLVGDFLVARFVAPATRERWTLLLALLLAVPYLLFALRPAIWLSAVIVVLANVGAAYQLGLQRRFLAAVPDAMRGQALGLVPTGIMALQGVTMSLAGWLAEWWSPRIVMPIYAALAVVSTLALSRHLLPARAGPVKERLRHQLDDVPDSSRTEHASA